MTTRGLSLISSFPVYRGNSGLVFNFEGHTWRELFQGIMQKKADFLDFLGCTDWMWGSQFLILGEGDG